MEESLATVKHRRQERPSLLAKRREEIKSAQGLLHLCGHSIIGIVSDGTLVVASPMEDESLKRAILSWSNIKAIAIIRENPYQIIGLKFDGSVVATDGEYGGEEAQNWTDIVALLENSEFHVSALKSDGTVVTTDTSNAVTVMKGWSEISSIYSNGFGNVFWAEIKWSCCRRWK